MILSIESSTKFLSIAIAKSYDEIFLEVNVFLEFSHTENLNKLLEDLKIKLSDINEVIISKGPGFFTSLRISTSFAKALKIVNSNIKFKAISSLKNVAYELRGYKVIPILQAPKNQVYACAYNENFQLVLDEGIYNLEFLREEFRDFIILDKIPRAYNLIKIAPFEDYLDIETFEPNYIREPDAVYYKRSK
ncbi:MAG: tRNA (adenosine(37)-N6)-threonylcarbamoyltransferase complex dimerization subunit type 1 TsaB [candidate division WOR-3 bacterium]